MLAESAKGTERVFTTKVTKNTKEENGKRGNQGRHWVAE
jgi:hypothetical protein